MRRFREDPRTLKVVAEQEEDYKTMGETIRRKVPVVNARGIKQQRNWKNKKLHEARAEKWKKRIIARARKDINSRFAPAQQDKAPPRKIPTLCGMPLQNEFSDLEEIHFNFSKAIDQGKSSGAPDVMERKETIAAAPLANLSAMVDPRRNQTKKSCWMDKYDKKMQEKEAARREKEHRRQEIESRKAKVTLLLQPELAPTLFCIASSVRLTYDPQAKETRSKWRRKLNAKTSRGQPVMQYHIMRILKQVQQESAEPPPPAPTAPPAPPAPPPPDSERSSET
ncbi:hypothetical protein GUITHDRAFT_134352 [Guillardia theta CCMP2712]|uniref:Uncharacterized protein n=1 Tax=Guillardia theta (strain CCMP2712) TaxID=905079 RepID=L1JTL0_GUITC|nr:hypothetical protein GUITHDRAFT_134352 [Guillardia theta CCMP2712]EKX51413.1 hypothetical protein GUITHDRAFT_134352 [Guillardia theta CCMP2712]|eukprot:XP_005838393.1 hypothetical protein GUITHDRAFT_134352 [Guillardia theta CCMP2712]